MTATRTTWQVLVLFGIGAVVGWLAGGIDSREASGEQRRGARRAVEPARELSVGRWDMSHLPARARLTTERLRTAPGGKEQMRVAIELANSVPVEEIEEWLDGNYADTTNGWIDTVCARILRMRLFEAAPERCVAREFRLDSSHARDLMTRWSREDPEAAEAFVVSQSDKAWAASAANYFLRELAQTASERGLELLAERVSRGDTIYSHSESLRALAEADRDGLLAISAGWSEEWREDVLSKVTGAWLKDDFAGAIAWLAGDPQGKERFISACRSERVGRAVLESAASLPEGWLEGAIEGPVDALVHNNPAAWLHADAASLGISAEAFERVQTTAAEWLARRDGGREEAMTLLAERTDLPEPVRRRLVASIVGQWIQVDRDAAERWVEALSDEELRAEGRQKLASEERLEQDAPVSSADLIATLAMGLEAANPAVLERGRYFSAEEMAETRAAFRALPADQRERAAEMIMEHWRRNFGAALATELAAEVVNVRLASGLADESAIRETSEVAASWGRADPRAAAEWVESLPPGEHREWAARNVFMAWAQHSDAEAMEWAEQLPESERESVMTMLDGE